MFPTQRHRFAGFVGRLTAPKKPRIVQENHWKEMPGTRSAIFYRQQAERLTSIAAEINNAATRLELLAIAANFRKLADYATANSYFAEEGERSESA